VGEFNGPLWETTKQNILKNVRTTLGDNPYAAKMSQMKDTLKERRGILKTQYAGIILGNEKNILDFAGTNQRIIEENFESVKTVIDEFLGMLENGVSESLEA